VHPIPICHKMQRASQTGKPANAPSAEAVASNHIFITNPISRITPTTARIGCRISAVGGTYFNSITFCAAEKSPLVIRTMCIPDARPLASYVTL